MRAGTPSWCRRGRFLFRVGPTEDGEHGLLTIDNMSLLRKYENKGMVLKGDSLIVTTNLDNTLRVYDVNKGQIIGKYLVDERQISNDLFSEVDSRRDPRFIREWSNTAHLIDLHYLQEVRSVHRTRRSSFENKEMREEGEGFGYYLVYDDQFRRVGRIDLDYGWLVGTADEGLLYMRQEALHRRFWQLSRSSGKGLQNRGLGCLRVRILRVENNG